MILIESILIYHNMSHEIVQRKITFLDFWWHGCHLMSDDYTGRDDAVLEAVA